MCRRTSTGGTAPAPFLGCNRRCAAVEIYYQTYYQRCMADHLDDVPRSAHTTEGGTVRRLLALVLVIAAVAILLGARLGPAQGPTHARAASGVNGLVDGH